MSLRALPDIHIAMPKAEVGFDLAPQALASWNSDVTAADERDNVISILDPIGEDYYGNGVTAKRISAALRNIGEKPVTVQINSPGGNFFEGLAIYNLLRQHSQQVTVQVLGIAASAASIIAMAGDKIEIAKAGLMMIHNVQWVAIGDRHAMQEAHDTMVVFDEALTGLYIDRSGEDAEAIGKMMDATTFLSGQKAVDLGFADEFLAADKITTTARAATAATAAYKVEAVLARAGVSRSERRRILKEITDKPGAVDDHATPSAGETVDDDGLTGISVALTRLKLMRA